MLRKLIIFCLLLLAHASLQARDDAAVIAVIVNPSLHNIQIKPEQLNVIFWRKQLYWPNGKRIKAVNLNSEHSLRLQFSQAVLGSAPTKQIDYWNGQYFNGVLPPHTLNSEEAVLRFIAINESAIGYVDACAVDARVQAILWITKDNNKESISTSKPADLHCAN
jgi:ABC-type phosphate transport system substrate-binding protein